MSPANQLDLQKALRDNSEDTKNTFRDLKMWEQEIKKKEIKIKNSRDESEDIPLITKSQKTADGQTMSKSEVYKTAGNKCYKAKEFEKAYRIYSKAIAENSSYPVLYLNRSVCSLNMKKYKEAIDDCNQALQLDAKLVKAYYRRMEANIAMQNYKLAQEDAQKLVELVPTNIQFKEKLEYVEHKVSQSEKERVQPTITRPMANRDYTSILDEIGTDIPFINKLPHLRSKQPLKKIRITPVHSSEAFTNPTDLDTNGNAEQITVVNQSEATLTISTVSEDSPVLPPLSENGIDFDFIEKPNQLRSQKPLKRLKIIEVNGNTDITLSSTDLTPSTPSIPTSSAQFYSDWKTLGTASNRFLYLKNINSVRLNNLLGAQFDTLVLSELLDVFATYFVPNQIPVLGYLQEIAKHEQMPIIQMFMAKSDRTVCQGLIDYINECHHAEMKRLQSIFLM